MSKFRVTIWISEHPFSSEASDIFETIQLIRYACGEKKLDSAQEYDILIKLAEMEHKDKPSDMRIAETPLSVTYKHNLITPFPPNPLPITSLGSYTGCL